MKKYAFGVDIGGTSIKMGLFNRDGSLLETWEIPTNCQDNGASILQDIADVVQQKIYQRKMTLSEIIGIGVGVPGPVSTSGKVLRCVNLGWGIVDVPKVLGQLTGLLVKVGNDANVAALGEMWQGGGLGYSNIVMVTLGTGVGGGVIVNGQIVSGINGAAGEIGHIPMKDVESVTCGCGKRGCLEQYASATGIVCYTKQYLKQNPAIDTSLRKSKEITAKEIFDAAKMQDVVALEMVDFVGEMLGKALAKISCVLDSEAFVIGGGMARAGDILIEVIRKHYVKYAFHASCNVPFKIAELGNDAGIYGGVKLLLDN